MAEFRRAVTSVGRPVVKPMLSGGLSAPLVVPTAPKEEEIDVKEILAALDALTKKVDYVQAQCRTLGEQINYGREQNKTLAREHAGLKAQLDTISNILSEDDLK